jgi:SNF2 family DNA or RNA helicase
MNEILTAVKAIASRCDGAVAEDGVGFNGIDARFGHSLAKRSSLTAKQERAAHLMLRKYRGQLLDLGIDFDELEVPEDTTVHAYDSRRIERFVDRIEFLFEYNADVIAAVKMIPGRKWDPKTKRWSSPINAETLEMAARLAQIHSFALSDDLKELLRDQTEKAEKLLAMSSAEDSEFTWGSSGGELFPFQEAGVEYALEAESCFIADEMGLGKTIQALAVADLTDSFPLLIVCPAVVKLNWKKECEKWLPDPLVQVLYGKNCGSMIGADTYIINYDILSAWKLPLEEVGFKMIIFDESHYLKNSKAKRTKAAKLLGRGVDRILMLSGTPILNKPIELVSQLQVMGRLKDFGGFRDFTTRYCGARLITLGREDDPTAKKFWDYSRATNLYELNQRLRSTCFVRRKKEDVLKDLPEKRISEIYVDIDNRAEYNEAEQKLIQWIGEQAVADEHFLASIDDLPPDDQLVEITKERHSAQARARKAEALIKIGKLKQLAAQGKILQVCDWISDFLDTGEKLVVFAHHREIVGKIAEMFKAPSITGEIPVNTRQEYVDRFQDDPDCNLIVCNIRAGGEGITLHAASNVLFCEFDWTPARHAQAEDRCHRIGQEHSVTCYYILGENTIDCKIHKLIEDKRNIIDASMNGETKSVLAGVLKEMGGL